MVYTIRRERPGDVPLVRLLNQEAFGRPDEGRLVDAVRSRSEPTFCLVGVEASPSEDGSEGRIVGHIIFSTVRIESSKPCKAVGLGPMAVHPAHQRAGIGGQLIEHGLEVCRAEGFEAVVVLGHPSYHPRFGFVLARTRGIHWEHEVPGDPFMVMELVPGALEGVTGVVRYLPEFLTV